MSKNIIDGIHKILISNVDGLASDRFIMAIKKLKCYGLVGKADVKVQVRWMTSFWANVLSEVKGGCMSVTLLNNCMSCNTFEAFYVIFKEYIMPTVSKKDLPTVIPTVPSVGVFE